MKVEELSQYGKALVMPKKNLRTQKKIIFNLLTKEFGLLGFFALSYNMKKEEKRIRKEYPEAVEQAKSIERNMDKQLTKMASMFFAISNKRGRMFAKNFMTQLTQKVATVSMPAIYQLSDLIKCEGDVFENYKKFNRAMFTEIDRMGIWKNSGIIETDKLLEFKVIKCIYVDFFEAVGCPEIGILGCDHDLAGYPLIEKATQSEFRRPGTLAKGDDCCHFHFYRKGTAPNNAHLNK